jgi:hypothetical protein
MALYPGATWRNSPNHGGPLAKAIGVVLHVEAGTEAGTCQVFSEASYKASSHFGIAKVGRIDQFADTAVEAWAQAAGNGSYFSIETEGQPSEPLTDAQIASFAKLYAWLKCLPNAAFGFTLADVPGQPGLGWHGMGGAAWGGHTGCPGDLRKAQRQSIIDLARPKGVAPMYSPPLQIVAELDCPTGGVWCLGPDGAVYAWGGAPYLGGCNGKPYFAGRTAARLNLVDGKYQVVATSGEVYGPVF